MRLHGSAVREDVAAVVVVVLVLRDPVQDRAHRPRPRPASTLWPGAICDGDTTRRAARRAVGGGDPQRPAAQAPDVGRDVRRDHELPGARWRRPRRRRRGRRRAWKLPGEGDVAPPTARPRRRQARLAEPPPGAPRWSTRVVWVPSGAMRAISRWLVSWSLRSPMTTWTSLTAPGVATVASRCTAARTAPPRRALQRGHGIADDGRAAGVIGVVAGHAGDQAERQRHRPRRARDAQAEVEGCSAGKAVGQSDAERRRVGRGGAGGDIRVGGGALCHGDARRRGREGGADPGDRNPAHVAQALDDEGVIARGDDAVARHGLGDRGRVGHEHRIGRGRPRHRERGDEYEQQAKAQLDGHRVGIGPPPRRSSAGVPARPFVQPLWLRLRRREARPPRRGARPGRRGRG